MTILVCGASGLVGKEICSLLKTNIIQFVGTYNNNLLNEENMFKIDFMNIDKIEYFLKKHKIKTCLFLIVQRLTDVCEKDWEQTKQVNIDMVNNTSYICNKLNIRFIHLSTDYVFDGCNQPNYPDDKKNPLQNYGMSKLISELKVQSNCSNYCIIRTPVLYSSLSKLHENAVTLISKKVMDLCSYSKSEDNYCLRRPLYIKDLCFFILDVLLNDYKGIYHFYNPYNCFTKYEIAKKIENILNIKNSIQPNNNGDTGAAKRPYDTMLLDNKFNIYDYKFTNFDESITDIFEKYKHPKINKNCFVMLDLDGTIIDSNYAHYQSYNNVFYKYNKQFIDITEWDKIITNSNIDIYLKSVFPDETEFKIIKREKMEELEKLDIKYTNGSEEFLKYLLNNKINFCIVTNTNKVTCDLFKKKLVLLNEIQKWIVREDYTNPKPCSECYEASIKKYYNKEKYIIGIEDTNIGYESLKSITNIIYLYKEERNNNFDEKDCFIFDNFKVFI
jgi:dTDP-4-dehydrorhamnose reductase